LVLKNRTDKPSSSNTHAYNDPMRLPPITRKGGTKGETYQINAKYSYHFRIYGNYYFIYAHNRDKFAAGGLSAFLIDGLRKNKVSRDDTCTWTYY